ncbi:MAG TPA: hypothetical protein VFQ61_12675 [Polyangiaceae bacterium]|nr:hypothetical protein [Polyangiaceae bacterium]
MMTTRRQLFPMTLGLLAGLGLNRSVFAKDAPSRLAVVVAKSSPLQSIGFHELKRLYMGETVNGPEGMRLVALNHAPLSTERVQFDKSVLGMSPEEVARFWIDRKIRGQSGAPKTVEPLDLLQRVVAQLRGAVGYCRLEDVKGELRVIKVDGRLPNEGGYPVST